MVDLCLVWRVCPFISFFFARLGVFLEKFGGKRPLVRSFLPRDCVTFRPVLLDFHPSIRHSLISYCVEMGDREIEARVGESESSSSSSSDSIFESTLAKPSSSLKPSVSSKLLKSSIPSLRTHLSLQASSSSSVTLFNAFSEECFLDNKDLESIRGRFQIPNEPVSRLPHTSEKACNFAHGEVSFYEATFSCGLRFPVHPFIHHLLSNLNIALGQLVPNAWRTVVSCMAIWFIVHDGEMITLNEFLFYTS